MPIIQYRRRAEIQHFPCCWVFRKSGAVAFSSWKTPIDADVLLYAYRKMLWLNHEQNRDSYSS